MVGGLDSMTSAGRIPIIFTFCAKSLKITRVPIPETTSAEALVCYLGGVVCEFTELT